MKRFRLKSISLLSEKEKRARKVEFDPRKTLIVGLNHTGKSSLIKSIFVALGAKPIGELDKWNPDTATAVEFTFDGADYLVVQQYGSRALFDARGRLVFAASSLTNWGAKFADLIGYNLVLADQKANPVKGDARTFFLPFYINQDGSWLANWSTFANLGQYKRPTDSVLDYFTGIRPPEFYQLRSEKTVVQSKLGELHANERITRGIIDKFKQTMTLDGPKTMPELFNLDVEMLTAEITGLNAEQEKLREQLVTENEVVESLAHQIKMATHALAHRDSDARYLSEDHSPTLVCPTCHAEHGKTFMDILEYTEDARVLRALVVRLKEDAKQAAGLLEKSKATQADLAARYAKVNRILETRRGDLKLDDVVRSMGAQIAFKTFADEVERLRTEIETNQNEVDELEKKLAKFSSRRRSKEIVDLFRSSYVAALAELNMPSVDTKGMKLTSRPSLSGSGGPRSMLAYYSALWRTCSGPHGSFSVPAVIDSPQQQGQDASNLPIMIRYISEKLHPDMQVILAVETQTEYEFDHVVQLDTPYGLLTSGEFNDVRQFVSPRIDAMNRLLLEQI